MKMDEKTSHFVFSMSALVGLLTATIVFGSIGDSLHAGEALAAFIGFASGSRSRSSAVPAALALLGAGAVSMTMSGCGASLATVVPLIVDGIKWTIEGASKLCDALDAENHEIACQVFQTLSGSN